MTQDDVAELELLLADYMVSLQYKQPRMISLARKRFETALVKNSHHLIDAARRYVVPDCPPGRICDPITLHTSDSIASQCGRCGRGTQWQQVVS